MSHEDWTNLLFDDIEIDVDDVVGIDFHAGSELAAEVQLKKEVDPSKYVGKRSELNNLIFEVSKVETDSTKVTFKSVPLNIPDEELIHLVKCYGGKMEKEQVEHEKLIKKTKKGHTVEFTSTTRYINATFPPNKRLKRFYWMQGPLPKDPMRRIVIEHAEQFGRQCGHCLRNSADPVNPCNYNGKTAACRKNNFEGRLTLSKYFAQLRDEDSYVSLKTQYQWNTEDDDYSTQVYSDEFVDTGDFDGEMEEEAPGPNQTPATSKAESSAQGALLSTEPATVRGEDSDWAAEMEELRTKVKEQQLQLEKMEEERKKSIGSSRRKSRETRNLRKEINHNLESIYNNIAETIDNKPKFVDQVDFNSSVVANCINIKDFETNELGKVVEKKDSNPWQELEDAIRRRAGPMEPEYLKARMKTLKELVMDKLLVKLCDSDRARSRSQSRSRSEEGDEMEDEAPAKSAKIEMEEEEEVEDKKPTVEAKAMGPVQQ